MLNRAMDEARRAVIRVAVANAELGNETRRVTRGFGSVVKDNVFASRPTVIMRPKKKTPITSLPIDTVPTLYEYITSRLSTTIKKYSTTSLVGRKRTDRVMKEFR